MTPFTASCNYSIFSFAVWNPYQKVEFSKTKDENEINTIQLKAIYRENNFTEL